MPLPGSGSWGSVGGRTEYERRCRWVEVLWWTDELLSCCCFFSGRQAEVTGGGRCWMCEAVMGQSVILKRERWTNWKNEVGLQRNVDHVFEM